MRGTLVESDIGLAKRNMKDSIFRRAFSDRGLVLELYKDLHPEAEDVSEDDVNIVTIRNTMINSPINDVGFIIRDTVLCLVEAQTSQLKSLLLRSLVYLGITYDRYIKENCTSIYQANESNTPRWEIYVIFTENAGLRGGAQVWKFDRIPSDPFDFSSKETVPIREGGMIEQYLDVCRLADSIISEFGDGKSSISRIFEECHRHDGALWDFLISKETEVMTLYDDLWTTEGNHRMNVEEEGRRRHEEGLQEGLVEGREEERHKIAMELLKRNYDLESISASTGISIEELMCMQDMTGHTD
ncbi:hypothetical protein AUP07_1493 [methanogenic archaeon mixed culture ISO4-G1]|nr:hypothetical protein AUP07_1493 [methanogenic archaeon mixed culture ISO4-G1]